MGAPAAMAGRPVLLNHSWYVDDALTAGVTRIGEPAREIFDFENCPHGAHMFRQGSPAGAADRRLLAARSAPAGRSTPAGFAAGSRPANLVFRRIGLSNCWTRSIFPKSTLESETRKDFRNRILECWITDSSGSGNHVVW